MPSEHYMVEAKMILGHAAEDVPRFDEIRTAIKDIWDIRAAKLRTSMDDFIRGEGTYAKLDYLTVMEIHSVRPLLTQSLDMIARLERDSTTFALGGSGGGHHTSMMSSATGGGHNTTSSMLSSGGGGGGGGSGGGSHSSASYSVNSLR